MSEESTVEKFKKLKERQMNDAITRNTRSIYELSVQVSKAESAICGLRQVLFEVKEENRKLRRRIQLL